MLETALARQSELGPHSPAERTAPARLLPLVLLGGVTLIAFALRVYNLGLQSFWLDEGYGAWLASRFDALSLLSFLARGDNHPPLYYLSLYAWIPSAGDSEFSIRFISAFAGTLSVPLLARLGCRLFDEHIGLLAAALLAISPFHLWYSQEARMYALLCLFAIVSVLLYLQYQSRASLRLAIAFVLVSVLMLLSHYYGFFILLFENSAFLFALVSGRQGTSSLKRWLGMQASIALLYAPWLLAMAQQFRRAPRDYQLPVNLLQILQNISITFSVGDEPPPLPYLSQLVPGVVISTESAHWGFALILFTGVALGGIDWRARKGSGAKLASGLAFAVFYLLSAPVFGYIITAALSANIRAGSRMYYIIVLPAYLLLLAYSIARLARANRALGLLAYLLVFGTSLAAMLGQSTVRQKEDFRSMGSYVRERDADGEVIVFNPEYIYTVFDHYYRGALPWHRIELGDEESTAAFLNRVTAGKEGAWLILARDDIGDPRGIAKRWFDRNGLMLDERWFFGGRVVYYSLAPRPNFEAPRVPKALDTSFAGKIRLLGYDAPAEANSGSQIKVKIHWQSQAKVTEDYRVVIYLQDRTGYIWSQADHVTLTPSYPTSSWTEGEYLADSSYFPVPLGTPPGTYDLRVRLYSASTGTALQPVDLASDMAPLGQMTVLKAGRVESDRALRAMALDSSRDLNDSLTLLDWKLGKREPATGESLDIGLLWRARSKPRARYDVAIQILDEAKQVRQEMRLPVGGDHATDIWDAGEVVRDRAFLLLSNRLDSGRYSLRASIGPGSSQVVELGVIQVRSPQRTFAVPSPQYPYDIDVGGLITFLGYDTSGGYLAAGDKLAFTPFWRAREEMDTGYKAFVHLLGRDGRIVAQSDGFPLRGSRPTTGWAKGEVLKDEFELTLPADLPAGDYFLAIGYYDPQSGRRLVVGDGVPKASENAILLRDAVVVRERP